MTVEHPNFCRQMIKQFSSTSRHEVSEFQFGMLNGTIELANAAQKFLLPPGGRLYDDLEFKALDESKPLRLPFPVIALEFHVPQNIDPAYGKRIVLVVEEGDLILLAPIIWWNERRMWFSLPPCTLPTTGYLDRSIPKVGGRAAIVVSMPERVKAAEYSGELGALLCFLNALQCSNVHMERSPARSNAKRAQDSLPFDDYHILSIDTPIGSEGSINIIHGSHRSPREHLRRGHIRRLENGNKIWVNAAIINAGKIGGKITKDYVIH